MLNIELLECAGCGAPLEASLIKNGLCRCRYCSYTNIMPKDDQREEVLLLLHDGDAELRNSAFERAYNAFSRAAELSPDESRAFFGMALAANRIKYIKDIVNKRCQPICFEITDKRFDSDKNYSMALDLAENEEQYREYERRAREIDYIRDKFDELAKSGARYDTFICVKVTEADGSFTQDSQWATRLYDAIKRAGLVPFYSERDIGDRLGEDYEAIILYALYCAKSMILVCSNDEYLRTPWVQNEYSRYYAMLSEREKKSNSITIAFNGNVIERVPGIPGKIEGVNLASFDASQKLCDFVKRFALPEKKAPIEKKIKLCVNCGAECDTAIKFCSECGGSLFAKDRAELISLRSEQEKRRADEERARREAEEKRANEEFERKLRETEERAKREAEERAKREAEERAKREAEERAKREADERAKRATSGAAAVGAPVYSGSTAGGAKYCLKCGTANGRDSRFCSTCGGTEFSATNVKLCVGCGAENPITAKFCSGCGKEKFVMTAEELERHREAERAAAERAEQRKQEEERRNRAVAAASERRRRISEDAEAARQRIKKTPMQEQTMWAYTCSVTGGRLTSCSGSFRYLELPNYGEKTVYTIGRNAFASSKVTALIVPDTVKTIEPYAFAGCTSLEYIFLPSTITSIGEYAFKGCSNLKYVTIPRSVKSIPSGVFEGCSRLQSLHLPTETTSVASNAFSGCTGLESLGVYYKISSNFSSVFAEIDKRVMAAYDAQEKYERESAERRAREEAERAEREEAERKARVEREEAERKARAEAEALAAVFDIVDGVINCYKKDEETLVIPEGTVKIEGLSYIDEKCATSVELPATLKELNPFAFEKFTKLVSVTVSEKNPNMIAKNGMVFSKNGTELLFCCPGKSGDIVVENGVTKIRDMAFNACKGITSIKIPKSVAVIEDVVFSNCKSLKRIDLPSSIKSIGVGAFEKCESLTNFTLPSGIKTVGDSFFSGCSSLTEIKIPEGVTSIGNYAFSECASLNTLILPESVKEIGESILEGSNAIQSITVPFIGKDNDDKTCAYLGYFFCLDSYEHVNLPDSLKSVTVSVGGAGSEAFIGCCYLKEITFLTEYCRIDASAFCGCKSLTSINATNPESQFYKSFDGILYDCDQAEIFRFPEGRPDTEFYIPDGVEFIGDSAFEATSLESVYIPGSVVRIGKRAFADCNELSSIFIPSSVSHIKSGAFDGFTGKIYCETKKPLFGFPKGWDKDWCPKDASVVWGYK